MLGPNELGENNDVATSGVPKMKMAFFDAHEFERTVFDETNKNLGVEISYFQTRLNPQTAQLASGFDIVCSFVNDRLDTKVLSLLQKSGVKLIALRSAGFNHVDLQAAAKLNLPVTRVPEYSPYAVAEFAVALLLSLNRKLHRALTRVHELNFSLEGLVGFDLHGKTVGVVGTGKIGSAFAKIMCGFGCQVLAYDLNPNKELIQIGISYTSLEDLYRRSDVISLHVPLRPETHHMVNAATFAMMKPQALLINTGRGGLVETTALIKALKSRLLGGAGLDVYEEEEGVFFEDHSAHGIDDDQLARLLTFPNVLITSHQAFLTREALQNIAETTLASVTQFQKGEKLTFAIKI